MRLTDVLKSLNFRDMTWVPQRKRLAGSPDASLAGMVNEPYESGLPGAPEGNAFGRVTPDEAEMIRSGASLNDIMFMRAKEEFGLKKDFGDPSLNPFDYVNRIQKHYRKKSKK